MGVAERCDRWLPLLSTGGAWLVTRGLLLILLFVAFPDTLGDIDYYQSTDDPREYPVWAVALLRVMEWPGLLGVPYSVSFVAHALLVDLLFFRALPATRGAAQARAVWVLGIGALGPVAFARFDIFVTVLVGFAVLAHQRSTVRAVTLLTVAAMLKIWPGALLVTLLGRARLRSHAAACVAIVALAVGATLAFSAWDRLLSPLRFQSGRGTNIEALTATPAMWGWLVDPATWRIALSDVSNAFEIHGPGMAVAGTSSTVLMALVVPPLLAPAVAALRRRHPTRGWGSLVAFSSLAVILALILSSSVLSPQFMMWPLAPLAAFVAVQGWTGRLPRVAWLVLAACALTQLFYPGAYPALTEPQGLVSVLALVALTLRNLVLVVAYVVCAREVWRCLRGAHEVGAQPRTGDAVGS